MCKILRSWLLPDVLSLVLIWLYGLLCTWGASNKFAKLVRNSRLRSVEFELSAESGERAKACAICKFALCMPANVDNSEKLHAIWRFSKLYIILFSLSGPKREKMVALHESVRLAWSEVATSMEGKSLKGSCFFRFLVFLPGEKWISTNKYVKKKASDPPTH